MITKNSNLLIRAVLTIIAKECVPKNKVFSSDGKRCKYLRKKFKDLDKEFKKCFLNTIAMYPSKIDSDDIRNIVISSINNVKNITDELKNSFESLYTDSLIAQLKIDGIDFETLDLDKIYDTFNPRFNGIYREAIYEEKV